MALNKKNKITLILICILICTACIVWITQSKKSTIHQHFYVDDIQSVTKIYIADKQNYEILVEKGKDSTWILDGQYEANMPLVNLLLETLNTMRISYPASKASLPGVIKTLSVSGIKVEVYQKVYTIRLFNKINLFPKEKLTKVYYIGSETPNHMGTYMLLKGEETPYVIHIPGFKGFLTPRFETEKAYWRSRKIFDHTVHALKSIKVEIPGNESESYEVTREDNSFKVKQLATGSYLSSFDTLRMAQFLSSFVNVNFDEFVSVVPALEIDSVFSKKPEFILTVTDTSNQIKSLKTYIKIQNPGELEIEELNKNNALKDFFDTDRLYAIIDSKDTVLIQYFVFDNILHPISFFLNTKK